MKQVFKSHSTIWMAAAILFMASACKKDKDPAPQAISGTAKSYSFSTLSNGSLNTSGLIFFAVDNIDKSILINPVAASDANATVRFGTTDLAGTSPTLQPFGTDAITATTLLTPNTIEITFDNHPQYTKLTATINAATILYLSGQTKFGSPTYTQANFRADAQALAGQVNRVFARIQ